MRGKKASSPNDLVLLEEDLEDVAPAGELILKELGVEMGINSTVYLEMYLGNANRESMCKNIQYF